ncbi:hypothetical protein, partial [Pleurochrysis sp. endemic virus unk]
SLLNYLSSLNINTLPLEGGAYKPVNELELRPIHELASAATTKAYIDSKNNQALAYASNINSTLQTEVNNRIVESEAYTDTVAINTLNTAQTYTNTVATSTRNTAQAYTDTAKSATIVESKNYTDTVATNTLNAAQAYTDTAKSAAIVESRAYTDTIANNIPTISISLNGLSDTDIKPPQDYQILRYVSGRWRNDEKLLIANDLNSADASVPTRAGVLNKLNSLGLSNTSLRAGAFKNVKEHGKLENTGDLATSNIIKSYVDTMVSSGGGGAFTVVNDLNSADQNIPTRAAILARFGWVDNLSILQQFLPVEDFAISGYQKRLVTARVVRYYVDNRLAQIGGGGGGSATSLGSLSDVSISSTQNGTLLAYNSGQWRTDYRIMNDNFIPSDPQNYVPTINYVQWRINNIGLRSAAYYHVNAHSQTLTDGNDVLPTSRVVRDYVDSKISEINTQGIQGPAGPTGPQGPQGPAGPPGSVTGLGGAAYREVNSNDETLSSNALLPQQSVVRAFVAQRVSESNAYTNVKYQESITYTDGVKNTLAAGAFLDVLTADEVQYSGTGSDNKLISHAGVMKLHNALNQGGAQLDSAASRNVAEAITSSTDDDNKLPTVKAVKEYVDAKLVSLSLAIGNLQLRLGQLEVTVFNPTPKFVNSDTCTLCMWVVHDEVFTTGALIDMVKVKQSQNGVAMFDANLFDATFVQLLSNTLNNYFSRNDVVQATNQLSTFAKKVAFFGLVYSNNSCRMYMKHYNGPIHYLTSVQIDTNVINWQSFIYNSPTNYVTKMRMWNVELTQTEMNLYAGTEPFLPQATVKPQNVMF